MDAKKQYYATIAKTLIQQFKKRNIEGYYFSTKEEALVKALSFLHNEQTITFGGSMTLEEIGLIDALEDSDYKVIDRRKAKNHEEKEAMYREAFSSDVYFMSSNAITLDGQLVNIDGNGNRVAALIYGPKEVIIVAGMNKLSLNVEEAIKRVQNFASPPNVTRLNQKTPCATTGKCENCLSDDCICCQVVITRKSRQPNRIKVILVGETLGY